MKIYTETSLNNFEFWSGAEETANTLDYSDLNTIEAHLEMEYPDGIDEEDLNDIFRFEEDYVAQILGYDDWDDLIAERGLEDED